MRPTKAEIVQAVEAFGMLRFFPANDATRVAVMRLLEAMVPTAEALNWLVGVMVSQVGEWSGPRDLRGVLCTRYRPLDGIEADCGAGGPAAGFAPEAMETRSIVAADEYRALPAAPTGLALVPLKRLPAPRPEDVQAAKEAL